MTIAATESKRELELIQANEATGETWHGQGTLASQDRRPPIRGLMPTLVDTCTSSS